MTMRRGILSVVYDRGEECIVPFKIPPGGGVGDGVVREDTLGRLHSFAFMSRTNKEEVNNNNKEENILLIPLNADA